MVLHWFYISSTIFVFFVVLFWQSLNFVKFLNILQFNKYCIAIRRNFYFFENPFTFFILLFSSATNPLLINFCNAIFLNNWFYYHTISFQWFNACFHWRRFNFSFCFVFFSILIGFFVIVVDIVLFVLILIIFKKHFGFFL